MAILKIFHITDHIHRETQTPSILPFASYTRVWTFTYLHQLNLALIWLCSCFHVACLLPGEEVLLNDKRWSNIRARHTSILKRFPPWYFHPHTHKHFSWNPVTNPGVTAYLLYSCLENKDRNNCGTIVMFRQTAVLIQHTPPQQIFNFTVQTTLL